MLKQLKQINSKELEKILTGILSDLNIEWNIRTDFYDVPYSNVDETIKTLIFPILPISK